MKSRRGARTSPRESLQATSCIAPVYRLPPSCSIPYLIVTGGFIAIDPTSVAIQEWYYLPFGLAGRLSIVSMGENGPYNERDLWRLLLSSAGVTEDATSHTESETLRTGR